MNQNPIRPIIVFEPNFRGHRMDFCRHLIAYANTSGMPVLLASSSDTISSKEYKMRFGSIPVEMFDLGPLPNIGDRGYHSWVERCIRQLREQFPQSHLIVLEGDKFLPRALRLSLIKHNPGLMTILVMRMPQFKLDARQSLRDAGKILLGKLLSVRGYRVVALKPATTVTEKYFYHGFAATPDPVDIHADAGAAAEFRREHLSDGRIWFGVFGHVTQRKNLHMIAQALGDSAEAENYGLLVAGKLSTEEAARCAVALQEMERSGVKLQLQLGLLSDSDLDAAIGAVDAVVVAHSSDGPSGIVGKALALNSFVVAAGAPVLQAELNRFPGLGKFVDLDRKSLKAVFDTVSLTGTSRRAAPIFADWREFSRALLNL